MLMCPHPPPDETPTLPPHLHPYHSLSFRTPSPYSPWIKILTLLRGPKVMPPTPPSPPLSLLSPVAYHPYACIVPTQHASNASYHPYACIVPTQHASNAAYHPYACSSLLMLLTILPRVECPPDMPPMLLTILTLAVPSRHASDTAYHPYAVGNPFVVG
ncbi:hypothetical protein O181_029276 [Austropuccinia psidii MF-1]|uniref:Uncharacterized protein n=1 Tax=Austropuccinia psidii MF-1 TaxID=1389203 RepID=A0A9Q3CW55_9BASI|nr:hypothetical protein [Austropuccinia psidii MF-1]